MASFSPIDGKQLISRQRPAAEGLQEILLAGCGQGTRVGQ